MLLRWSQVYALDEVDDRCGRQREHDLEWRKCAVQWMATSGGHPDGIRRIFFGLRQSIYLPAGETSARGYSEANYLPIRVFRESLRPSEQQGLVAPSLGAVIRESGMTSACMRHVGHRSSLSDTLILRSVCTTITLRQLSRYPMELSPGCGQKCLAPIMRTSNG